MIGRVGAGGGSGCYLMVPTAGFGPTSSRTEFSETTRGPDQLQCHLVWACLLRGSFVFVDQPAEDGPAFDPLVGRVDGGSVGAWGLQLQRPMRTPLVVVAGVRLECSA